VRVKAKGFKYSDSGWRRRRRRRRNEEEEQITSYTCVCTYIQWYGIELVYVTALIRRLQVRGLCFAFRPPLASWLWRVYGG
jgi:hypothetical protein